jgi:hypothetical protein
MKLEFSLHIFEKNVQITNTMKTRSLAAELFYEDGCTGGRTDGQTYMLDGFNNI